MSDKMFSTENLGIGNKVIVSHFAYGERSKCVGVIKKKTPTGLVDVKYGRGITHRYKANGMDSCKSERYSNYSTSISFWSKEQEQEIVKAGARREMIKYLKSVEWDKYTDDELDNILRYLSRLRTS